MGEIADEHVEAMWFDDRFDSVFDEPFIGGRRRHLHPTRVKCDRCGAFATWQMTSEGWRLFGDNGEQHVCVARADEFEVMKG